MSVASKAFKLEERFAVGCKVFNAFLVGPAGRPVAAIGKEEFAPGAATKTQSRGVRNALSVLDLEGPEAAPLTLGIRAAETRRKRTATQQNDSGLGYAGRQQRPCDGKKCRTAEARAFVHNSEVGLHLQFVLDPAKLCGSKTCAPLVRLARGANRDSLYGGALGAQGGSDDRAQRGTHRPDAYHGYAPFQARVNSSDQIGEIQRMQTVIRKALRMRAADLRGTIHQIVEHGNQRGPMRKRKGGCGASQSGQPVHNASHTVCGGRASIGQSGFNFAGADQSI